jgi:hypothetical protein
LSRSNQSLVLSVSMHPANTQRTPCCIPYDRKSFPTKLFNEQITLVLRCGSFKVQAPNRYRGVSHPLFLIIRLRCLVGDTIRGLLLGRCVAVCRRWRSVPERTSNWSQRYGTEAKVLCGISVPVRYSGESAIHVWCFGYGGIACRRRGMSMLSCIRFVYSAVWGRILLGRQRYADDRQIFERGTGFNSCTDRYCTVVGMRGDAVSGAPYQATRRWCGEVGSLGADAMCPRVGILRQKPLAARSQNVKAAIYSLSLFSPTTSATL